MTGTALRRIGFSIGATLLALGLTVYVGTNIWQFFHSPQPLILPVSLRVGTIKSKEIRANLARRYDIVLDLKRKPDVGSGNSTAGDTSATTSGVFVSPLVPHLVDISWKLFEGDKLVSEADGKEVPWETRADTMEGVLGSFEGKSGGRYILVLQVNRDASQLDVADPKIVVQIPRDLWEDYGSGPFIQKLGAGAIAIVGALILAVIGLMSKLSVWRPA